MPDLDDYGLFIAIVEQLFLKNYMDKDCSITRSEAID